MKRIMYREAIAAALAEEMRLDEKVFVMGEDVAIVGGVYKATKGLLEEFGPQRVRNTPLSELAIMGTATGAAMCGARPVAEIMHIDFIGCGFDILLNQMSKMRYKTNGQVTVPLVIRTQCGRGRSNGCTQSQSLESLLTHIPGLKVVMPSTPYDVKGLLKSAIRDNDPVIFIEHKGLYQTRGEIPEEEFLEKLPELRKHVPDRAILRAIHVYQENKRVKILASALRNEDLYAFFHMVRQSGQSSWMYLQNIYPSGAVAKQEVAVALTLCDTLLKGRGAYRVHGGGFAGTVQAFVPFDMLTRFKSEIERVLGEGKCHVLNIRADGGIRVK